MNTTQNVFLLTAATTLVGFAVATIRTDLWGAVIEFVLGIIAFIVYEKTPPSQPSA